MILIPPQAVILAAGKGTRMRSEHAKVLEPALGQPLLAHVLTAVEATGADPIVLVVGHRADQVEAAFGERRVLFRRQEPQRGTGHALQAAQDVFSCHPDQTLLVVSGDVPLLRGKTLVQLLETHGTGRAAATLLTVMLEEPGMYGRIVRNPEGNVARIVEARDASAEERTIREINASVYAFHVPSLVSVLGQLQPQNAQGEYYLTDAIALLVAGGHTVKAVLLSDPAEALGVNTFQELADVNRRLRERVLATLVDGGVRIEDPATTHVGLDVVVEHDVVLRPFTFLEGKTVVRSGAAIGPFVRVTGSEIGRGAQILDHSVLAGCAIDAGAVVGPFAHIRPDTHVGRDARVGSFVELAKTTLGDNSRAPHLAYLDDVAVGPSVNVGAGTIACGQDGTTLNPRARITEDVPPRSLATTADERKS